MLRYAGRTFAELVVAAVAQRAEQVVLLGCGTVPHSLAGLVRLPDPDGIAGPLAGLLAALRWQPTATWLIVACDLPLVSVAALDWLLTQRRPEHWAVLPRAASGYVEPLLAVYEPAALKLLEELARQGQRSPSSLDGCPHVHTPPIPARLRGCWTNINTLEDLRLLDQPADPSRPVPET